MRQTIETIDVLRKGLDTPMIRNEKLGIKVKVAYKPFDVLETLELKGNEF